MPVWEWLVREGLGAYEANQQFDGPDVFEAGPGWCFDRFGCSETELPDGRIVHIAGEHEDSYDPDFYIYNDVIVRGPDDDVTIFGYPEDVFPPTDFHSATLVGDEIWILGSLGYPDDRMPGTTPAYVLSLDDMSIRAVTCDGEAPGWIRKHDAHLSGSSIVLSRGEYEREDGSSVENVDDYALDLATCTWSRLTTRPYQQWSIARRDGEPLMLFDMSCAAFEEQFPDAREEVPKLPDLADLDIEIEMDSRKRLESAGRKFDRTRYEQLYVPAMEHEVVETEEVEECVTIDGALVRFVEITGGPTVELKIEGSLAPETVRALIDDFVSKLEVLQDAECHAVLDYEQGVTD